MRMIVTVFGAAVIAAALSVGITYQVMQKRVQDAEVSSFNDGFRDGACRGGEDGFGNPCSEG
ncbi:hypothetical protein [Streptomyces flavofungini]|uniref:hypothetical protein n=1 Tax=Streptomyces flavofungini TaxID=68200 RepID=UPI0025B1A476|nr:hypothetical protein [Streptomyces flavofungini]WJV49894.1 hypothetical protein QUY26_32855 [Streptomyces flavofungini]